MKDAERIYALYVQANPVPDPDLLPLTRDEVVFLPIERNPDMITKDQAEVPQGPQAPRRRSVATALGATALIGVVALVVFLVVNNGEAGPVAAADAAPVITFDGTTCTYAGPTLIEEGLLEFSLVNSADEGFTAAAFLIEESTLAAELEGMPMGSEGEVIGGAMPNGEMSVSGYADAGASQTVGWLPVPGNYLIDCVVGNPINYAWRTAQIEVVAP